MISTEYTVDNEIPQAIPLQEDPKNLISSITCTRYDKEHETNVIAHRKKTGSNNGWLDYYKKQLQQKPAAHADEIARLKNKHREEKENLVQQLKEQQKCQISQVKQKLIENYEQKIAALQKNIIEQERELALFRDQNSGKGNSEKFTEDSSSNKPKRKKRKKAKNPGRKQHTELPVTVVPHDLPESEKRCSVCGLSYDPIDIPECSEVVDYKVVVRRIRNERKSYKQACKCPDQPKIKTDLLPPRALEKSKYTDNFCIELLLHKYYYQLPLTRFIKKLQSYGMKNVSPSTLTYNIERMSELLAPFDKAVIEKNLKAGLWQIDDTRLAVFVLREDRATYNWALMQYRTTDTIVFQLNDTKEAFHVQTYFANAEQQDGLVFADRAKTFQTLWFAIAYCWVHMRRDFIRIGKYTKGNRTWAVSWIKLIKKLFHCYKQRRKADADSESWHQADAALRNQVDCIHKKMITELDDEKLNDPRRKVLNSLQNHWQGLTKFLDNPQIPLDNNLVEQIFRIVANLRKTSYGVFSEKFGHITARILTVFMTLEMHHINIRDFLQLWFEAVAINGGTPPENVADYLPWSMSEQVREKLQYIREGPT